MIPSSSPVFHYWKNASDADKPIRRLGHLRLFGLSSHLRLSSPIGAFHRRVFCFCSDRERLFSRSPRQSESNLQATFAHLFIQGPEFLVAGPTPSMVPTSSLGAAQRKPLILEPVLHPTPPQPECLGSLLPGSMPPSFEQKSFLESPAFSTLPIQVQTPRPIRPVLTLPAGPALTQPTLPRWALDSRQPATKSTLLFQSATATTLHRLVHRFPLPSQVPMHLPRVRRLGAHPWRTTFFVLREYRFGPTTEQRHPVFPARFGDSLSVQVRPASFPGPRHISLSPLRQSLKASCPIEPLKSFQVQPSLKSSGDLPAEFPSFLPAPVPSCVALRHIGGATRWLEIPRGHLSPRSFSFGPPVVQGRILSHLVPSRWPTHWSSKIWGQLRRLRLQARSLSCPKRWAERSDNLRIMARLPLSLLIGNTAITIGRATISPPSQNPGYREAASFPFQISDQPIPSSSPLTNPDFRFAFHLIRRPVRLNQAIAGCPIFPKRPEPWAHQEQPRPFAGFRPTARPSLSFRLHQGPSVPRFSPGKSLHLDLPPWNSILERPHLMVFLMNPICIPARQPPLPRHIRFFSGTFRHLPGFMFLWRNRPLGSYHFTRDVSFEATFIDYRPVRKKLPFTRPVFSARGFPFPSRGDLVDWAFSISAPGPVGFPASRPRFQLAEITSPAFSPPRFSSERPGLPLPPCGFSRSTCTHQIPRDFLRSPAPRPFMETALGAFPFGFEAMRLRLFEFSLSLATPFLGLRPGQDHLTISPAPLSPKRFFRHFSGSTHRTPRLWPPPIDSWLRPNQSAFQDSIPAEILPVLPGASHPRVFQPHLGPESFAILPFTIPPRPRVRGFRSTFFIPSFIGPCRWGNLNRLPSFVPSHSPRHLVSQTGFEAPLSRPLSSSLDWNQTHTVRHLAPSAAIPSPQLEHSSFSEERGDFSVLYHSLARRIPQVIGPIGNPREEHRFRARFRTLVYPWQPAVEPFRQGFRESFLVQIPGEPVLEDLVTSPFNIDLLFHSSFPPFSSSRAELRIQASAPLVARPAFLSPSPRESWESRAPQLIPALPRRPAMKGTPRKSAPPVPITRSLSLTFVHTMATPVLIVTVPGPVPQKVFTWLSNDLSFPTRLFLSSAHFVLESRQPFHAPGSPQREFTGDFPTLAREFWCSLLALEAPPPKHLPWCDRPTGVPPFFSAPKRVLQRPLTPETPVLPERLPYRLAWVFFQLSSSFPWSKISIVSQNSEIITRLRPSSIQARERTTNLQLHFPGTMPLSETPRFTLERTSERRSPIALAQRSLQRKPFPTGEASIPDWIDPAPWKRPALLHPPFFPPASSVPPTSP